MPRQSGYAVTIHGFIEVPTSDLKRQGEAAIALQKAIEKNDISAVVDMMRLDPDGVSQKFVRRNDPHMELPDRGSGQTASEAGKAQGNRKAA